MTPRQIGLFWFFSYQDRLEKHSPVIWVKWCWTSGDPTPLPIADWDQLCVGGVDGAKWSHAFGARLTSVETTSTQPVGGNSAGGSEMLDSWMVPAVISTYLLLFVAISRRQLGLFVQFQWFWCLLQRVPNSHRLFKQVLNLDSMMPAGGRLWQEPDWMHFNTLCPIPAGRHAGFVCNVFERMSGVNNIPWSISKEPLSSVTIAVGMVGHQTSQIRCVHCPTWNIFHLLLCHHWVGWIDTPCPLKRGCNFHLLDNTSLEL